MNILTQLFKKKDKFKLPTYEEGILKFEKLLMDLSYYCNINSLSYSEDRSYDMYKGLIYIDIKVEFEIHILLNHLDDEYFKYLKDLNLFQNCSINNNGKTKTITFRYKTNYDHRN